jgi:hypothetical protein
VAALEAAFARAAIRDREGAPPETYRLGGHLIRVRVAGAALRQTLARALAHLRVDGIGPPALTVTLWDGEATGVPCPVPYLRNAFHRTWPFGRHVLASAADESVLGFQTHAAVTVYDRATCHVAGWVAAEARLSLYERGKPLQPLLFAWQSDLGTALVHAGLVARGDRGLLFGGAGGSGKTTSALTCMAAGFDYLGDDYIGLPPLSVHPPCGYSFYASTWLEPDHAQRFPDLLAHAHPGAPDDDKLMVLLPDVPGTRLREAAEIVALVLPRVAGVRESSYRPASRGEAVLRLAPSSILQLPLIRPRLALERMADLARRVPAYWLDLGTDLATIPARVDEILDAPGVVRDR